MYLPKIASDNSFFRHLSESETSRLRKGSVGIVAFPLVLVLVGCDVPKKVEAPEKTVPYVLTTEIRKDNRHLLTISGTIKARYETPKAFQVGGRIVSRKVDSGIKVEVGDLLFALDPRDFDEAVTSAEAMVSGAEAILGTAKSELERQLKLAAERATSEQSVERARLAEQTALSQLNSAKSVLMQARNARSYSELTASTAGVLVEVLGEVGQVVGPGQTVAILAQEGEREIEVYLADGTNPPATGLFLLPGGDRVPCELREVAGAADPVSRSWRARYRVKESPSDLPLGAVVQCVLLGKEMDTEIVSIPLTALDERSGGARIWQIKEGKAFSVAVKVVALETENARVKTDLKAGEKVIAFGTHLLNEGMEVRERSQ
ncbi:MAG: hypothetical protein RLY14_1525 [Planctomycetota bacterium]|jgi:RND family efflux transporter MFP subunit